MRTLATLALTACLALVATARTASADDDWKDQLRDGYKQQKRALKQAADRYEDDLKRWHDMEDDRLDAARRDAWRNTWGCERIRLMRLFREQERALDDEYDRQEDALVDWYDQEKDLLRDGYHLSKDWSHGPGGHLEYRFAPADVPLPEAELVPPGPVAPGRPTPQVAPPRADETLSLPGPEFPQGEY